MQAAKGASAPAQIARHFRLGGSKPLQVDKTPLPSFISVQEKDRNNILCTHLFLLLLLQLIKVVKIQVPSASLSLLSLVFIKAKKETGMFLLPPFLH